MSGPSAKSVKEDISRAVSYARRFIAIKALKSGAGAFAAYANSPTIIGRAKFELEILLLDMLRELELVPDIKAQLRGPFKFKKGSEKRFALALAALAMHLEKIEEKNQNTAVQENLNRIAMIFDKAREAIKEKNMPAARRVLSSVCEQNSTEPSIYTKAGKMLAEADLHLDAIPFLEKAMEINPRDAAAFSLAVESCKQVGELEKAEKLLRDAMRFFGAHPKTYVSLARVLYQMGRWDQAYDAARAAYDRDSTLAEAKEILDLTERRVMG